MTRNGGRALKRKLNNRGFSLLELLVGVTILAIVVVPLIHAFVSSAATSTKAKRLRSETIAAQNILESYQATSIGELLALLSGGDDRLGSVATVSGLSVWNTVTAKYEDIPLSEAGNIAADGPGYKLELGDIRVDNKQYDAVIYLDATAASVKEHNDAEIINYKAMDALYVEPNPVVGSEPTQEALMNQAESPDYIAAANFASMATIESGLADISYHDFLGKMRRSISISIQKVGADSNVISCSARFDYETEFTYSYPIPDENGELVMSPPVTIYLSTSVPKDIYSGSYDGSGNYGLYFFFYPNTYSGQSALPEDSIEIQNGDNIPISVFLIRQGDELPGYAPVIRLRERTYDFFKPQNTKLHYQDTITYRYYYSWDNSFYRTIRFDGILIDTEAKNRLYEVKVALYKDGADLDTDEPLAVFDASSLG